MKIVIPTQTDGHTGRYSH